ncbi:tripartite tricarboxylate transporter TctB family protein [Paractinoplanes brasiliensis]|uniref:Putative tricarboxylic transport membrane protein n=1 Tax=Paractinoplanes brasiliensis TaxID=52695 RepID=A0A4R6JBI7_9ACTN|nr:tripartite tricarboxylate transporter TctB family protein [Actinoplanes brasiliensis]TDO32892.1 putative tricarboxylic transport membrane protein [Actinoplanes brasiliensis]GID28608.1 hypothetical protein Abr02nite_35910 [Actinoplanes brasiliensis]
MPIRTEPGRRPQPQTVLAAALLLVGFLLLWSALTADGDFGLRGPRLAPVVVTSAWVAAAAVLLVQQLRPSKESATPKHPSSPDNSETPELFGREGEEGAGAGAGAGGAGAGTATTGGAGAATATTGGVGAGSTAAPLGVLAALAGFAIALEYAGFVVSAALFTVVTARMLGSRHLVRDVIVAIVLPVVVYLAFTRLLDIFLPAGVFPL